MDLLPLHLFRTCVQRYEGNRSVHSSICLDPFLCMAFAPLTSRRSVRDIEVCRRAPRAKLDRLGLRGGIARNTLAHANKVRNWRIDADHAQALLAIARPLYADEDFGLELDNTLYALDASTIDLGLSVCPWAWFRSTEGAVKLHTWLDLRGNIPTFIHFSDGKLHDVDALDLPRPEPAAFFVMDRGYVDFQRLFALHASGAFFVLCAKSNPRFRRR